MAINKKQEVNKIVERFKVSPEFVEIVLDERKAATVSEKLRAFNKERDLITQEESSAVKNHHEKGKLTARERIGRLLDSDTFEELDLWHMPYETGFPIGEELGMGDGVVVGYGLIKERPLTVWAQDATVMGGSVGTVHARKVTMIMENALNARTPIVAIFDSEGLRAQDLVQYPDFYSTSSMARFQTRSSGVIPKISLVMGPCHEDLALVAALGDFLFMVKDTSYMHLMPPSPDYDGQEIGDSLKVHAKLTGSCDVIADNDEDCLDKCRELLSYLPSNCTKRPPVVDSGDDPNRREEELLELVPVDSKKPFDMHKLIALVTDNGAFFEIKKHFASNLITGFARLGGQSVGIIANNPRSLAGCMTLDAADKMSRFVRFCDAFNIPCIWFADTPAFLPAIQEETRGLIRHGSRMVMANAEATVPQVTVVIRKAYGGGRLSMPGQFLMGDLQVAWPTHEPGLMGAEGAVSIIYRKELQAIPEVEEREVQKKNRIKEMQWSLNMQVREAAQKIIDPRDTRPFLIKALRWLRDRKQGMAPRKHEIFRV